MSWREPSLTGLPSTSELSCAPERAILAALDASLVLASRALKAEHPSLDSPDESSADPLILLAGSILASAASLHELIVGYEDLTWRLTGPGAIPPCPPYVPRTRAGAKDDDIPF